MKLIQFCNKVNCPNFKIWQIKHIPEKKSFFGNEPERYLFLYKDNENFWLGDNYLNVCKCCKHFTPVDMIKYFS